MISSKNIFRLGVKELWSLVRDPMMLVLIAWTFTVAIYVAATAMPDSTPAPAADEADEAERPLTPEEERAAARLFPDEREPPDPIAEEAERTGPFEGPATPDQAALATEIVALSDRACFRALTRAGVAPIVAADLSPTRRALATTMGAHEVVDPRDEPAIDAWRRAGGSGSPVIFEAVGNPGLLDAAITAAPGGSQILVVGVCMQADTIRPMVAIAKELQLQFVLGYDPMEFAESLRLIAEGEIDVAPLVTGTVDVAGVPGAFEALADPDAHAKILVVPST